jgi:RNA polymerase sigma factor (sigma-70 family)
LIVVDKYIIEGCKNGDRECQYKLYKLLASRLLYKGMRYIKSKQEVEDCLQESFVKIFKSINTFKGDSSFETWATRIMINTVLTKIRININEQNYTDLEFASTMPSNDQENLIDYEDLLSMLNSLPDHYRVIFNMHAIEGYSHNEIADILEMSEATSRSYLHRAKEMLKVKHEQLNSYYNERNLS